MGRPTLKSELFFFLAGLVPAFLSDRLSKAWVMGHCPLHEHVPCLPGLFDIYLTQNRGAAFSMGNESGAVVPVVACLTTAALLIWSYVRLVKDIKLGESDHLERIGAGILIGASLGNLYDRFAQGHVTDFICLTFINFPVFNVADVLIDVGIGFLIISILRNHAKQDREKEKQQEKDNESNLEAPQS